MRLAVFAALGVAVVATAAAAAAQSTFYLDLKAGQCARPVAPKHYLVLSCSNATHQFEIYAIVHGGWAHAARPSHSVVLSTAQRLCTGVFQRRYGGPIRSGYGWEAFWPDPGAEATKYADKIVCSLIRWPGHPAMGAGTHFRAAAG